MAAIIDKKPKRHTNGATLIRRALKMSGLKACSVEPLPAISLAARTCPRHEQEANYHHYHADTYQHEIGLAKCEISSIHYISVKNG